MGWGAEKTIVLCAKIEDCLGTVGAKKRELLVLPVVSRRNLGCYGRKLCVHKHPLGTG